MTIQALIDSLVEEWHAEELRPLITRCVLRAYALGVAETAAADDAATNPDAATQGGEEDTATAENHPNAGMR